MSHLHILACVPEIMAAHITCICVVCVCDLHMRGPLRPCLCNKTDEAQHIMYHLEVHFYVLICCSASHDPIITSGAIQLYVHIHNVCLT